MTKNSQPPQRKDYSVLLIPLSIAIVATIGMLFYTYMGDSSTKGPEARPVTGREKAPSEKQVTVAREDSSISSSLPPEAPRPSRALERPKAEEPQSHASTVPMPPDEPITKETQPPKRHATTVLWRAGILNGFPSTPTDPHRAQEYAIHRTTKRLTLFKTAKSIPQILCAGHAIQLSPEVLTKGNYVLKLAINTGVPRTIDDKYKGSRMGALEILLNQDRLYHRKMSLSSNLVSIFLPAASMKARENMITVANRSAKPWALDSIWVESVDSREKLWVALGEADWLDAPRAKHIPQMAISLHPMNRRMKRNQVRFLNAMAPVYLGSLAERQATWGGTTMVRENTEPVVRSQHHFDTWRERIGNALMRGAEPVVFITTGKSEAPEWLALYAAFRPYVRFWYLECRALDHIADHVKLMKKLSPDAKIGIANRAIPCSLVREVTPAMPEATVPYLTMEESIKQQTAILKGGCELRSEPTLITSLHRLRDLRAHYRVSVELSQSVVGWLHERGSAVVVRDAALGKGLFPVSAQKPSITWDILREILPVGRGKGLRLPMNLQRSDSDALIDTSWCAAQNSANESTILISAGLDSGSNATVSCLVPWQDDTIVEVSGFKLALDRQPTPLPIQRRRARTLPSSGQGVVNIPVELTGLVKIRLLRENAKGSRQKVVSRKAVNQSMRMQDLYLFERGRKRFKKDMWMQEAATIQRGTCRVLGSGTQVRISPATVAPFAAEKAIVPWNENSIHVMFSSIEKGRPTGVYVSLPGLQHFPNSTHLEFWVRASAEGAKHASLLCGSQRISGKIRLKVGRWHCIRTTLKKLSFHQQKLYVWPDRDDLRKGQVTLEFNAFHALGKKNPEEKRPTGLAEVLEYREKDKVICVLVAPVGRAVFVTHRLEYTYAFDSILAKNIQTKHYPLAGFLQISTPQMPRPSSLSGELLKRLPGKHQLAIRKGDFAAVRIECQFKTQ